MAGKCNLEDAIKYELCTFPPALFETTEMLNEPQKAAFVDALWGSVKNKDVILPKPANYIIDGGALLHRNPWKIGSSFFSILKSYTDSVVRNYGNPVVVFYGYGTSSTKDMAHRRRAKGKKVPTVSFTKEMILTVAKDLFLSDKANKQQFIGYLAQDLEAVGCEVFHATADADVLIVQKAIDPLNNKILFWLEMTPTYLSWHCTTPN